MKTVVLVGLMGSGKSTVGALVAQRTGRALVDVDAVITARMSKTVRELWEEGGEAAYRYLESDVVLEVLRDAAPTVLAAPGGAVLDPAVRAALVDSFVVWLRTSPSTLAGRVRSGDHRPLLEDSPAEAFAAMAEMRSGLYRQVADAIIDTDGRAPESIADEVVGLIAGRPRRQLTRRRETGCCGHRTPQRVRPSGSTACGASRPTRTGWAEPRGGGAPPFPRRDGCRFRAASTMSSWTPRCMITSATSGTSGGSSSPTVGLAGASCSGSTRPPTAPRCGSETTVWSSTRAATPPSKRT